MQHTPQTSPSAASSRADQHTLAEAVPRAIATGVADVRREPDIAAELVTQALLGTPTQVIAEINGWVQVRLPDYEGWVQAQLVARAARTTDQVAVVTALQTPIYLDETDEWVHDTADVTTVLPVLESSSTNGRVCVVLPESTYGWLDAFSVEIRTAAEPFPHGTVHEALALARQMLGVPYLWGGTTPRGTDCSGLAQLCWRYAGVTLRRDADQQYESISYVVARGELRAGDLAFFARDGRIVHVGIMLDGTQMLHADGTVRHQVTINGLTPDSEDYSPRLDALYAGARRPQP